MHFIKITQNGQPFHLDLDKIESVRELPANPGYGQGFRSPKGCLAIYTTGSYSAYVLTVNADINAFYAAFAAVAYPGQPAITSTLGT